MRAFLRGVLLILGAFVAPLQAQSIGYLVDVRGRWTIDGQLISEGDALRTVKNGALIAHAGGAFDGRDSVFFRVGDRLVTIGCSDKRCDAPATLRRALSDSTPSDAMANAIAALEDPVIRAMAAVETVLSDDLSLVDGVVEVRAGAAELRPLIRGPVERGIFVVACRWSDASCTPESDRSANCEIKSEECRVAVSADGVYRLGLYRRRLSNGKARFETTESGKALAFISTGTRYSRAKAEWEALDRQMRLWKQLARSGELAGLRRALLLRSEMRKDRAAP